MWLEVTESHAFRPRRRRRQDHVDGIVSEVVVGIGLEVTVQEQQRRVNLEIEKARRRDVTHAIDTLFMNLSRACMCTRMKMCEVRSECAVRRKMCVRHMSVCIHCAQLRSPRGAWANLLLILDNAPSHTARLACERHKTVLHGTIEFDPRCSPDLSPLDFFFMERAQSPGRSVSSSCQSAELRVLLTHAYHRTCTGSRWVFEKMGKACVAAKVGFIK